MSAPAAPRRARRDPTRPDDDIPDEVTPDSVLATMGAETELVESLMDEDRQPLQPGPLSDAAESFRESFEQRPVKTVGFAAAAVCVAGISVKLLLILLRRVRRRGGRNRRSSDTALDVTGCAHAAATHLRTLLAARPFRRRYHLPDRFCAGTSAQRVCRHDTWPCSAVHSALHFVVRALRKRPRGILAARQAAVHTACRASPLALARVDRSQSGLAPPLSTFVWS